MRYLRLIAYAITIVAIYAALSLQGNIAYATNTAKPNKIDCNGGSPTGDKDSGFYCTKIEKGGSSTVIFYQAVISCPAGYATKVVKTKLGTKTIDYAKICEKKTPETADCVKEYGSGYISINGRCFNQEERRNAIVNSSVAQSLQGMNFESILRSSNAWRNFAGGDSNNNEAFQSWYLEIMESCIRYSGVTEIEIQSGRNSGNKFVECVEKKGISLTSSQKSEIAAKINKNPEVNINNDSQNILNTSRDYNPGGNTNETETENSEDAPGCNIESMGWIICPTMSIVAGISDSALGVITSFLTIKPSILDMGSKTHEAWSYFRNIANVLFAVMFMWVIFSQVSNVGISNYGIKKMLPKLIIGAILVNASFIICQGAVDLSNILGNALSDFFGKIAGSVQSTEAAGVGDGFAAVILGGLALAGALALAFLAISVPTLLAVLLVLISVVVILIARQAIVILLIAISPVAFVAWLLPNTEGLFKKWLGLLKGMLVVFPIISLLYGTGKLASAILNNAAGDAGTVDAFGMQIAALGASVIPLGATPLVLRSSLNSLGTIGGKLGGLTSMANKNLMGAVSGKSRLGDFGRKIKSGSAQRQANRRAGNGQLSRAGKWLSDRNNRFAQSAGGVASLIGGASARLDTSPFGRALGLDKGVYAAQDAVDKAADEAALRELTYKYGGDAAAALNNSGNSHVQKMAVKQLAGEGEYGAVEVAKYLRSGRAVTSVGMAKAMSEMKGSHAGVGAAGTEALKSLQANPDTPVSFEPEKLDSITVDALAKMSAESISRQSADAINSVDELKGHPKSSKDLVNIRNVQGKATEILGSNRLRENTNEETRQALSKL